MKQNHLTVVGQDDKQLSPICDHPELFGALEGHAYNAGDGEISHFIEAIFGAGVTSLSSLGNGLVRLRLRFTH